MAYRINKVFWFSLALISLMGALMYAGAFLVNEGFASVEARTIVLVIALLFFAAARAAREMGVGLVASNTYEPFYQLNRQMYRVLAKAQSRGETDLLIVADLDETSDWTIRVPAGLIKSEYFRIEGSPKRVVEIYDRSISQELAPHMGGSDFYRATDPLRSRREQAEDSVFTLPSVDLSLIRE